MRPIGRLDRPDRAAVGARSLTAVPVLLSVAAGTAMPPREARGQAPKPGGTLRVALHLEPTTLDPHGAIHATGVQINKVIFESLVQLDAGGAARPLLATAGRPRRTARRGRSSCATA